MFGKSFNEWLRVQNPAWEGPFAFRWPWTLRPTEISPPQTSAVPRRCSVDPSPVTEAKRSFASPPAECPRLGSRVAADRDTVWTKDPRLWGSVQHPECRKERHPQNLAWTTGCVGSCVCVCFWWSGSTVPWVKVRAWVWQKLFVFLGKIVCILVEHC